MYVISSQPGEKERKANPRDHLADSHPDCELHISNRTQKVMKQYQNPHLDQTGGELSTHMEKFYLTIDNGRHFGFREYNSGRMETK